MSDMQCNSSSCIAILAMAMHVVHALIIAKTWSSRITRLNVLSDRWDCTILGRLVRKKASQLILCDRRSVICLHTIDHCDTSQLVVWQHRFSPTLLQHTVTSNHVSTLKSMRSSSSRQAKTDREVFKLMCVFEHKERKKSNRCIDQTLIECL